MKKLIPANKVLTTFTGEPLKEGEKPLLLKDILLAYLSESGQMNLSQSQKSIAYAVGMRIGICDEGDVSLSIEQYDILKKICDKPEIKVQSQQGEKVVPLPFKIFVTQQVKELVDGAETVNDSDMMGQELQKRQKGQEQKEKK